MPVLLSNNAASVLQAPVTAAATTLTVASGEASRFPMPGAGDWFPLTLTDGAGALEIVRAIARSGAVITIQRGQEGTTAVAWAAGSAVELRLTAAAIGEIDAERALVAGNAAQTFAVANPSAASHAVNLQTADARYPQLDANAQFTVPVRVSRPAGQVRDFRVETNGSPRWQWGAGTTAETGANAGSTFFVNRFNDAGAVIDAPLTISRQTGAVNFAVTPAVGLNLIYHGGNLNPGDYLRLDGTEAMVGPLIFGVMSGLWTTSGWGMAARCAVGRAVQFGSGSGVSWGIGVSGDAFHVIRSSAADNSAPASYPLVVSPTSVDIYAPAATINGNTIQHAGNIGAGVATIPSGGVGSERILVNGSGGTLAENGVTAGANLLTALGANGSGWGSQAGTAPAGTWRNVSGASIPNNQIGLFRRVS
ncbi:hypothetical protein [Microcystis phage Mwe-JY25]